MFPEIAALFLPSTADAVEIARQRSIVEAHTPRTSRLKAFWRRWCA